MIYLDFHSTTPCDPRILDAMHPFFFNDFGNPSSSIHYYGNVANKAIEFSRYQVANLINSQKNEIVFTSGATESNNLAILGLANGNETNRKKIVTSRLEHKSISEPIKHLEKMGYSCEYINNDFTGRLSISEAKQKIDNTTFLVSIQYANNEIGTIQDLKQIAKIAHNNGAFFHTDATQAVGFIPINIVELDIDLLSFSSHKIYGPKGVGALYIKGGKKSMPIKPIMFGGHQEFDLRPGTPNVAGIVGFGEACKYTKTEMPDYIKKIGMLRDEFETILKQNIPLARFNGHKQHRLPNNSSVTIPNIESEILLVNIRKIALSNSSACNSGAIEPSRVLTAIGLEKNEIECTFRVGLGKTTTKDQIAEVCNSIIDFVNQF